MTSRLRECLDELAEEVRVVDMHDRVLRGSRRITLRNRVVASVAVVVAMSGTAVGVAAVRPDPAPPPPKPSATPSALPNVDVEDAMFEVPEFPGGDGRCPAAVRWFEKGYVRAGGTGVNPVSLRMTGGKVRADVDGLPGDEILLEMTCWIEAWSRSQVLAVKVRPDGKYTSLGYVVRSPDHASLLLNHGSVRVERGTVFVDVLGPAYDGVPSTLDLQTRGYAYRNGEFVQVSGPTAFASPPADYRRVDLRNATTCVKIPRKANQQGLGYLRTRDGKGTVTLDGVRYEVTVLSSAVFYSGSPWSMALYRVQPELGTGPAITVVNLYLMYKPMPCAYDVILVDGIDGATHAEMRGSDLRVTVGGTVKTFHKADGGLSWVSSA